MPKGTSGQNAQMSEGVFVMSGKYYNIRGNDGAEYAVRTKELFDLTEDYDLSLDQLIGRKVLFYPSSRRLRKKGLPIAINVYLHLDDALKSDQRNKRELQKATHSLYGMPEELPEEKED